jgi:hypothetical protein
MTYVKLQKPVLASHDKGDLGFCTFHVDETSKRRITGPNFVDWFT